MADASSKSQKLASARKKFLELKKEKKKNSGQKNVDNSNPVSSTNSREPTPVDYTLQESHIATAINSSPIKDPVSIINQGTPGNASVSNYFAEGLNQTPAAFFDSFAQSQPADQHINESVSSYFTSNPHQIPAINNGVDDMHPVSVVPQEATNIIQSPVEPKPQYDGGKAVLGDVSDFQAFDSMKFDENKTDSFPLSSVESLNQLSQEMAELIKPYSDIIPSNMQSQLELRNQELAALLSEQKLKNDQLNVTLDEHKLRIAHLENEIRESQLSGEQRSQQELNRLREELQSHVQAVGILVAEKTELSANLNQFQSAAKQKTQECEELQGRLKTSRSRVADLEREINNLKSEKSQQSDHDSKLLQNFHTLQNEFQTLKRERDELFQDLLEAREKLKSSSETNLGLQQQVSEVSAQLSMANIKIQQLTSGETYSGGSIEIENLTQEKFALEKKISELSLSVKNLTKDREESSLQYQQYAQQLNGQMVTLANRLEELQKENEDLRNQEQSRVKHLGELEKQLQALQNEQMNYVLNPQKSGDSVNRKELDAHLETIHNLNEEIAELREENLKLVQQGEEIVKSLANKDEEIGRFQETLEELKSNQPDNVKLLAIMESDKVAAARAVSQNNELKKQLESMQEVCVKLNDDKVDLTEKLTQEQRQNKELFEKIQKTEGHVKTLADAIEIKDKELCSLRDNSLELDKKLIATEQLTDRLRHYEATNHSSNSLQHDLQEANQTILRLNEEIKRLKAAIAQQPPRLEVEENRTDSEKGSMIEELKERLKRYENGENRTLNEHDLNDNCKLDREAAMKHLEAKFLKTMEDIAELTEEKQRLEHLVLQLQSETETIGEYVALYQHQRSLLKQKAVEKDQQLTQLANDREQIKSKLEKLNELVRKLVSEKGTVPRELLEHHADALASLTNGNEDNLCEEHAKIHDELNRITQRDGNEVDLENGGSETAEQIISLLAEIKSSNLVQPSENFHHCPWCSGQLITV